MPFDLDRRRALHAAAASTLLAALSPARACEFFTTHLRVLHPWARATSAGDRTAVVAMVFDEVRESDRLIGVETPLAARAEFDGRPVDVAIPRGRTTSLGETGAVLRLVGLTQVLEIGRTYPLTLRFARGGLLDADLTIDYERGG